MIGDIIIFRSALHDNNVSIREGAVEALHAALALISERENRLRLQWYHKIYEESQKGLRQNTVATIHGSLITLGIQCFRDSLRESETSHRTPLVLGELLRNTGEFMNSRFKEVCDTILRYRDHKEKIIKRTVISLLPRLAAFSSEEVLFPSDTLFLGFY